MPLILFLFDPYFKKYESWRDNGLDEVKSILNKKQNTIMISLDLKEYYYSSRINFNQLKKDMKKARERLIQKKLGKNSSVDNNDEEINDFLNDFIEKVFENYHKKFSFKPSANEKDSDNSYMIPLGFLPSLIIANWNLQGFDQAILENIHPNYYGRYVDDILIVLPSHEKSDSHGKQHIEKLTLETVIKKYLTPCEEDPINNILQIKNNSKKNTYFIQNLPIFSLENENYNYEHLEIQQEKFKVYFFNHKNSQAIIDKFRKAIAVNSSEFRLLHGVELTAKNLKYDLYQMSYEDSINKLRGIHDFKLNKYECSLNQEFKMSEMITNKGNSEKSPIYFDTLEGVQQLLKELPEINYELGKYGATVLELACAYTTDIEVIRFLLNHGANVHHSDKYGRNAFAHAWFNKAPYMDVLIIEELKKYW